MHIEIEVKLKVDSLERVAAKLAELGAEFRQEQLQTDCHFDDANMTLQKTDRCLRLRRQVVDKSERFFLTYKGAKEQSSFKKRQEIEIEVIDSDSVQELLSALRYEKVLVIEKKRRTWHLDDCVVALDQLPLIGNFVEIEGPSDERIADVQSRLGLESLPHIAESYALLIEQKLRQLNKAERQVFL